MYYYFQQKKYCTELQILAVIPQKFHYENILIKLANNIKEANFLEKKMYILKEYRRSKAQLFKIFIQEKALIPTFNTSLFTTK